MTAAQVLSTARGASNSSPTSVQNEPPKLAWSSPWTAAMKPERLLTPVIGDRSASSSASPIHAQSGSTLVYPSYSAPSPPSNSSEQVIPRLLSAVDARVRKREAPCHRPLRAKGTR